MRFDQMPGSMRQMIETMGPIQVDPLAVLDHEPKNAIARSGVELGGIRTVLNVPMLKEKQLVGAFMLSRQEVRPFIDKQVALVMNFARQVAIAIENARLLSALRERTDQLEVQGNDHGLQQQLRVVRGDAQRERGLGPARHHRQGGCTMTLKTRAGSDLRRYIPRIIIPRQAAHLRFTPPR
jgi:transcriptional regulator with GAF, ATPase, and Fis domain